MHHAKPENVPFETQRAMNTAALFTNIYQKYLDMHKCEFMTDQEELDQFSSEILDHVIIVGGFCRDVLLQRSVNDIDIIVNLRELCKLQTNHLKKYHSKKEQQGRDCRCVYWQLYLQKFDEEELKRNEAQAKEKEMVMMHNLNYIFNSRFWLRLLREDAILKNSLSVTHDAEQGYASAQIVNVVQYGGINLDRQCIDFIDTFTIDKHHSDFLSKNSKFNAFHRESRRRSMGGLNIDREDVRWMQSSKNNDKDSYFETNKGDDDNVNDAEMKANKSRPEVDNKPNPEVFRKKGRLQSMAMIDFKMEEMGSDFGNFGMNKDNKQASSSRPEYIAIEVPIYSGKVRYKLLNFDFSINTAIVPLSSIINMKHHNNAYNDQYGDNEEHSGPMTWTEIIENGVGECDALIDCQKEKILRVPEENHEHCTIESHPQTYIFWRIIHWMIREPTFKIGKKLINAQIEDYNNWLKKEWFENKDNCKRFMNEFMNTLETEVQCESCVKQMFEVMEKMAFHTRFKKIVHTMPDVRNALIRAFSTAQCEVDYEKLDGYFEQYGYKLEKQSSSSDPAADQLKEEQDYLKEESLKKDKRIRNLLEEVDQKNMELQKMKNENEKLLQQIDGLNKTKMELAVNADKTINQLRKYLLEYQQAFSKASQR